MFLFEFNCAVLDVMDLSASAKVFCCSLVTLVQGSAAVAVTVRKTPCSSRVVWQAKIKQNNSGHFSDEAHQNISSSVQLTQVGETCMQKKLSSCPAVEATVALLSCGRTLASNPEQQPVEALFTCLPPFSL